MIGTVMYMHSLEGVPFGQQQKQDSMKINPGFVPRWQDDFITFVSCDEDGSMKRMDI